MDQDYPGSVECLVCYDHAPSVRPLTQPRTGKDRRIRVLANDRLPGPAGARNSAAVAAEGDLLAFCDDDDRWLPQKLRLQVEAMQSSGLSVATCGIRMVTTSRTFVRVPPSSRVTLDDLARSRLAWLHTSSLIVRRDSFTEGIGPFDEHIAASYGEDYDWAIRAARQGPIAAVGRPLVEVSWAQRGYADRWQANVEALPYLLQKHPEIRANRHNLARMSGQVAFAFAALSSRRDAVRWAYRAVRADWSEPRPYIALLVAFARLSPAAVLRALERVGKGI
jgi:glycosyltransferase involved in cell wall biosynthesis